MKKPGREKCRYCGRAIDPADPEHARYWPFCSSRCKMAELGHWFEGRYVISRRLDEAADDAAPPGAGEAKPPKSNNS